MNFPQNQQFLHLGIKFLLFSITFYLGQLYEKSDHKLFILKPH